MKKLISRKLVFRLLVALLAVGCLVSCGKKERDSELAISEIDQSALGDRVNDIQSIVIGVAKDKGDLKERINAVIRDSLNADLVNAMVTDAVVRNAGEKPSGKPVVLSDEAMYSPNVLRVACNGDYAPMNETDTVESEWTLPVANARGEYISGADVEVIKTIANALKMNVIVFKVKQDRLIRALTNGGVDLAVSSYSQANDLKGLVDFTIPYYQSKTVMVTRQGSDEAAYNSVGQFKGKSVVARHGTVFEELLKSWSDSLGLRRVESAKGNADLLQMVRTGEVDAMLAEYPVALNSTYQNNVGEYYVYRVPDSLLSEEMKPFTRICFGTAKGSPWTEKLDQALSKLNIDKQKEAEIEENITTLCRGQKIDDSKAVVLSDEAKSSPTTLRVAIDSDNMPLSFTTNKQSPWVIPVDGQSGQYVGGIDVEVLKMVANELKVNLAIYKMDFEAEIPSLVSGVADVAMTISPTEKRKQSIDFSQHYFHTDMGLFLNANTKLAKSDNVDDCKGLKITAKKGSVQEDLLKVFVERGAVKSPALQRNADVIVAVKSGVVDGGAFDYLAAQLALDNQEKGENLGFWGKVKVLLTEYWRDILNGIVMTLVLAIVATSISLFLGLLLAMGRELTPSDTDGRLTSALKRGVKAFCDAYVAFFRGTPLLVQAMLVFFGIPIWTDIESIYIFGGYFLCALVVMSLHYAAYMCEIIRGGLLALDKGQTEGALALGFTKSQANRYVLLPQAIKNSLPAILNEYIVSLKDSSILNVIGLTELFGAITIATNINYFKIEGYVIVAVIYLILTFLLSYLITIITKKIVGEKIQINPFKHAAPLVISDEDKL